MSDAGLEKARQRKAEREARFPGTPAIEATKTPAQREAERMSNLEAALPQIRAAEKITTEPESDIHVVREKGHRKGDRNRYRNTPPSY